jgi:hypothetical protein
LASVAIAHDRIEVIDMPALLMGGYIPAPYIQTTGGDTTTVLLGIAAILAFAVAVAVALFYAGRPKAKVVERKFRPTQLPHAA